MENYCRLCGGVLAEGETYASHHQFKKMCLNCKDSKSTEDGNGYLCINEANRELIRNKMIEAAKSVSDGYSVDSVEISPLPLKKPNGKCKHWELSEDIKNELENLFV